MRFSRRSFQGLVVGLGAVLAAGVSAQDRPTVDRAGGQTGKAGLVRSAESGRPPFAGVREPELKRGLFENWKASHRSAGLTASPEGGAFAPAVGRASMVINSSGTVLYTRQTPGASCDVDQNKCGTTGCPSWVANTAFPLNRIVRSLGFNIYDGLLFQALNAGTSGAVEPSWPVLAGGTVVDGGITWKAIGYDPATLSGCVAMQIVSRTSGGTETVIATEGDTLADGTQLSGWGEFLAANDSGVVAFKAALVGRPDENDEGGSVIMTAGPGPGNLKRIADSPATIDGKQIFGYASMVAINNAGQVLFDGYGRDNNSGFWQSNFNYGVGVRIQPSSSVLEFRVITAGTSGLVEPNWPTTVGQKISDGSVVWQAGLADGDENNHNLIRYTPGVGNEVLLGQGDFVPADWSVDGFGDDDNSGPSCSGCRYDNFDGRINSSGHAPVVVTSNPIGQTAFLLLGPGSNTVAAQTGDPGPGGNFGTIYPRININDSDQMVFVADVGGLKKILRWTPPSTFKVIAAVDDDIGTLSGGAPTGVLISDIGFFADINNSGNVVFQATLTGPDPLGFFFWTGSTGLLSTVVTGADYGGSSPFAGLAAEMITLNNSDLVAFAEGSDSPESTTQASEALEQSVYFWTKSGGLQKVLAVGDSVSGQTVSAVYAQHTSFVKRQLNNGGCLAVRYYIANQSGDSDEEEGSGSSPDWFGTPPGGQLLSTCGIACNAPAAPVLSLSAGTANIGTTVTLTWTNTLGAGQGAYNVIRTVAGSPSVIATVPAALGPTGSYVYTVVGPNGQQDFKVQAVPNCNPALSTTSNTASLTVTGCAQVDPPPHLIIDSTIVPAGSTATLTWDPPFPGFGGTYTVLFSTDGGATFAPFASALTNNVFAFTVQFAIGTTAVFEVVADPGCGPFGISGPSPTVSMQVVEICPPVGDPVLQVDRGQVAVGDSWGLHWTPTLPGGLGGPAGTYEIRISEDFGASYHSVGNTQQSAFTGPPVPQTDLAKIVFLQVIARPSCATAASVAGYSNVVFFVVLPGCEAPQAASNAAIAPVSQNGQPLDRAPFPTEQLSLSWDAPTSGNPPAGYLIRINGDPQSFVAGGTGTIVPPRGNGNPVTLYVTSVACFPRKSGPEIQSPTVALLTAPPGADFSISPNPRVGQPVTFTDTSSPEATDWLWLFDDGTQQTVQSPSKTFSTAGTHTVALIATNGAGSATKVESFSVAPGGAATVSLASTEVSLTNGTPGRRRASVSVAGLGGAWLRLSSSAPSDTTLFLRFLDAGGGLIVERRLVVAAGATLTQDLGAYGPRGSFDLELVGDPGVSATIVRTGRSTMEVRR